MSRRWAKLYRLSTIWCCAGALFQTVGCVPGTNEIVAGLTASVVNSLVSSLVFGAFNLTP